MNTEILLLQQISKSPIQNHTFAKYGNCIDWFRKSLTVDELISIIQNGYSWTSIYNPTNVLKKNTFCQTSSLVFNIKSIMTMEEYLRKMNEDGLPLPTFAYTPSADLVKGLNAFKLVYCFAQPIIAENLPRVYDTVSEKIHFDQGTNGRVGSFMVMSHNGCSPSGRIIKIGAIYN